MMPTGTCLLPSTLWNMVQSLCKVYKNFASLKNCPNSTSGMQTFRMVSPEWCHRFAEGSICIYIYMYCIIENSRIYSPKGGGAKWWWIHGRFQKWLKDGDEPEMIESKKWWGIPFLPPFECQWLKKTPSKQTKGFLTTRLYVDARRAASILKMGLSFILEKRRRHPTNCGSKNTVEGRNPAPPGMCKTLRIMG